MTLQKRSTCVTAPYHQRKIMHQQRNWAQSWIIVSWQSKEWVAFIAKDMQCVTYPQSPTRDARDGSRGWWEGRRASLSHAFLLPITPREPLKRESERRLGTSQQLLSQINPWGPFVHFLFYVILTILYLWEFRAKTSSLLGGPCLSKSRFSGYFARYTRELLGCPRRDFA